MANEPHLEGTGLTNPRETSMNLYSLERKNFGRLMPVTAERLPQHLIRTVVINSQAAQKLPPELRLLTDPETLIGLALFTIPFESMPSSSAKTNLLIPYLSGRNLPVAEGIIPYNNALIGVNISEKGGGMSGYYYYLCHKYAILLRSFDPIGFFGFKDAKKEIEVSNLMLDLGARASLSLGCIELDSEELKKYVLRTWHQFPQAASFLIKRIEIIEQNGDTPAILFRIGGGSFKIAPCRIRY